MRRSAREMLLGAPGVLAREGVRLCDVAGDFAAVPMVRFDPALAGQGGPVDIHGVADAISFEHWGVCEDWWPRLRIQVEGQDGRTRWWRVADESTEAESDKDSADLGLQPPGESIYDDPHVPGVHLANSHPDHGLFLVAQAREHDAKLDAAYADGIVMADHKGHMAALGRRNLDRVLSVLDARLGDVDAAAPARDSRQHELRHAIADRSAVAAELLALAGRKLEEDHERRPDYHGEPIGDDAAFIRFRQAAIGLGAHLRYLARLGIENDGQFVHAVRVAIGSLRDAIAGLQDGWESGPNIRAREGEEQEIAATLDPIRALGTLERFVPVRAGDPDESERAMAAARRTVAEGIAIQASLFRPDGTASGPLAVHYTLQPLDEGTLAADPEAVNDAEETLDNFDGMIDLFTAPGVTAYVEAPVRVQADEQDEPETEMRVLRLLPPDVTRGTSQASVQILPPGEAAAIGIAAATTVAPGHIVQGEDWEHASAACRAIVHLDAMARLAVRSPATAGSFAAELLADIEGEGEGFIGDALVVPDSPAGDDSALRIAAARVALEHGLAAHLQHNGLVETGPGSHEPALVSAARNVQALLAPVLAPWPADTVEASLQGYRRNLERRHPELHLVRGIARPIQSEMEAAARAERGETAAPVPVADDPFGLGLDASFLDRGKAAFSAGNFPAADPRFALGQIHASALLAERLLARIEPSAPERDAHQAQLRRQGLAACRDVVARCVELSGDLDRALAGSASGRTAFAGALASLRDALPSAAGSQMRHPTHEESADLRNALSRLRKAAAGVERVVEISAFLDRGAAGDAGQAPRLGEPHLAGLSRAPDMERMRRIVAGGGVAVAARAVVAGEPALIVEPDSDSDFNGWTPGELRVHELAAAGADLAARGPGVASAAAWPGPALPVYVRLEAFDTDEIAPAFGERDISDEAVACIVLREEGGATNAAWLDAHARRAVDAAAAGVRAADSIRREEWQRADAAIDAIVGTAAMERISAYDIDGARAMARQLLDGDNLGEATGLTLDEIVADADTRTALRRALEGAVAAPPRVETAPGIFESPFAAAARVFASQLRAQHADWPADLVDRRAALWHSMWTNGQPNHVPKRDVERSQAGDPFGLDAFASSPGFSAGRHTPAQIRSRARARAPALVALQGLVFLADGTAAIALDASGAAIAEAIAEQRWLDDAASHLPDGLEALRIRDRDGLWWRIDALAGDIAVGDAGWLQPCSMQAQASLAQAYDKGMGPAEIAARFSDLARRLPLSNASIEDHALEALDLCDAAAAARLDRLSIRSIATAAASILGAGTVPGGPGLAQLRHTLMRSIARLAAFLAPPPAQPAYAAILAAEAGIGAAPFDSPAGIAARAALLAGGDEGGLPIDAAARSAIDAFVRLDIAARISGIDPRAALALAFEASFGYVDERLADRAPALRSLLAQSGAGRLVEVSPGSMLDPLEAARRLFEPAIEAALAEYSPEDVAAHARAEAAAIAASLPAALRAPFPAEIPAMPADALGLDSGPVSASPHEADGAWVVCEPDGTPYVDPHERAIRLHASPEAARDQLAIAANRMRIDGGAPDWDNPVHVAAAWVSIFGGDRRRAAEYLDGSGAGAIAMHAAELPPVERIGALLRPATLPAGTWIDLDLPVADQPEALRDLLGPAGAGKPGEIRTVRAALRDAGADVRSAVERSCAGFVNATGYGRDGSRIVERLAPESSRLELGPSFSAGRAGPATGSPATGPAFLTLTVSPRRLDMAANEAIDRLMTKAGGARDRAWQIGVERGTGVHRHRIDNSTFRFEDENAASHANAVLRNALLGADAPEAELVDLVDAHVIKPFAGRVNAVERDRLAFGMLADWQASADVREVLGTLTAIPVAEAIDAHLFVDQTIQRDRSAWLLVLDAVAPGFAADFERWRGTLPAAEAAHFENAARVDLMARLAQRIRAGDADAEKWLDRRIGEAMDDASTSVDGENPEWRADLHAALCDVSDARMRAALDQALLSGNAAMAAFARRSLARGSPSAGGDDAFGLDPAAREAPVFTQFFSGMSRTADLRAGISAVSGEAAHGIGVNIRELSEQGIEELAAAIAGPKTRVFVDTGAFSAFRANQRRMQAYDAASGDMFGREDAAAPAPEEVDFDEVFRRYDALVEAVARHNAAEEEVPLPMLVMPDIVGDQAGSLDLLRRYARWISASAQFNVERPIVPIQKGALSLADAWRSAVDILGTDRFTVGIPSNAKAVSDAELAAFLAHVRPRSIHFLGTAAPAAIAAKLAIVRQAGYTPDQVSADANILRSELYGRSLGSDSRADAIRRILAGRVEAAQAGPSFRAGKPARDDDAAALPRAKIRQRQATAMGRDGPQQDIARALQALAGHRSPSEVFRTWITVLALALGAELQTPKRPRTVEADMKFRRKAITDILAGHIGGEKQSKEAVANLRETFANMAKLVHKDIAATGEDVLGRIFMGMDWGNAYTGQFFTPDAIGQLLARISVPDSVEEWRKVPAADRPRPFFYMQEPACGAGALMLSNAQSIAGAGLQATEYFLDGVELDDLTARMAFVQCALAGVPARIWRGNALEDPREWRCIGATPAAHALLRAHPAWFEAVERGEQDFHPGSMKVDAATANPPFGKGPKARFSAGLLVHGRLKPLIRVHAQLLRWTYDRSDRSYGADVLVDGKREIYAGFDDLELLREMLKTNFPGARFSAGNDNRRAAARLLDATGLPLILHRGLQEEWDPSQADGKFQYWTPDAGAAAAYAKGGEPATVVVATLAIRHPFDLDDPDLARDLAERLGVAWKDVKYPADLLDHPDAHAILAGRGYDGVVYAAADGALSVVSMRADQISLVGSEGIMLSAGIEPAAIGASLQGFDLHRAPDEAVPEPAALSAALAELDRIAPFARVTVADWIGYDGTPQAHAGALLDYSPPAQGRPEPLEFRIGLSRNFADTDASGFATMAIARATGFLSLYLSGRFSIQDVVDLEEAAQQDDWKSFAPGTDLDTEFGRVRLAGHRYAAWVEDTGGGSLGASSVAPGREGGPAGFPAFSPGDGELPGGTPAPPNDRLTPAVRALFARTDLGQTAHRLDDPALARMRLGRLGADVGRYAWSAGIVNGDPQFDPLHDPDHYVASRGAEGEPVGSLPAESGEYSFSVDWTRPLREAISATQLARAPAHQWAGTVANLSGIPADLRDWVGLGRALEKLPSNVIVNVGQVLDHVARAEPQLSVRIAEAGREVAGEANWREIASADPLRVSKIAVTVLDTPDEKSMKRNYLPATVDRQWIDGSGGAFVVKALPPGIRSEAFHAIEMRDGFWVSVGSFATLSQAQHHAISQAHDRRQMQEMFEPADSGRPIYGVYTQPGDRDRYGEAVLWDRRGTHWPSPHWDLPNAWMQLRFTRRGNTLCVEEIQSDVHQLGLRTYRSGARPGQPEMPVGDDNIAPVTSLPQFKPFAGSWARLGLEIALRQMAVGGQNILRIPAGADVAETLGATVPFVADRWRLADGPREGPEAAIEFSLSDLFARPFARVLIDRLRRHIFIPAKPHELADRQAAFLDGIEQALAAGENAGQVVAEADTEILNPALVRFYDNYLPRLAREIAQAHDAELEADDNGVNIGPFPEHVLEMLRGPFRFGRPAGERPNDAGIRFSAGPAEDQPELGWTPLSPDFLADRRWQRTTVGRHEVWTSDAPHLAAHGGRLAEHVRPFAGQLIPFASIVTGIAIAPTGGARAEVPAAYFHERLPDGRIAHIVFLNQQSKSPRRDLAHEVVHALRTSGRIADAEWRSLAGGGLCAAWRRSFDIDARYPFLGDDDRNHEAVAEAYGLLFGSPAWRKTLAAIAGQIDPSAGISAPQGENLPGLLRPHFEAAASAHLADLGIGHLSQTDIDEALEALAFFARISSGEIGLRQPDTDLERRLCADAGLREPPTLLRFSAGAPYRRTKLTDAIDAIDFDAPPPAGAAGAQEEAFLAGELARVAPHAKIVFADVVVRTGEDPDERRYVGAVSPLVPSSKGPPEWLVAMSRYGQDRFATLHHEAFHTLWISGRIGEESARTLRAAALAQGWKDHDQPELTAQTAAGLNELASERYGRWAASRHAERLGFAPGLLGGRLDAAGSQGLTGERPEIEALFEDIDGGIAGRIEPEAGIERSRMDRAGFEVRKWHWPDADIRISAGAVPTRRQVGWNVDAVDLNDPSLPDRIDAQTEARLRAIAARVAPFVELEFADAYVNARQAFRPDTALDGVSGVRAPARVPQAPAYFVGVARAGVEPPDITLHHELFHTLWLAGRIAPDQFDILRAAAIAEKWPSPHGYAKLDPNNDIHLNEIAAERYAGRAVGSVHRGDGLHEGRGAWKADGQVAGRNADHPAAGHPAAGLTSATAIFDAIESGAVAAQPVEPLLDFFRFRRAGYPERSWQFSAGAVPPEKLYHGTLTPGFRPGGGCHFGTRAAAIARLADLADMDPRAVGPLAPSPGHRARELVEVRLTVRKPVEMSDGLWDADHYADDLLRRGVVDAREAGALRDGTLDPLELLAAKGYDAICYANTHEEPGSWSWMPFDDRQVRHLGRTRLPEEPKAQDAKFAAPAAPVRAPDRPAEPAASRRVLDRLEERLQAASWMPTNRAGLPALTRNASGLDLRIPGLAPLTVRDAGGRWRVEMPAIRASDREAVPAGRFPVPPAAGRVWRLALERALAAETGTLAPIDVDRVLVRHQGEFVYPAGGWHVLEDGAARLKVRAEDGAVERSGASARLDAVERELATARAACAPAPFARVLRAALREQKISDSRQIGLSPEGAAAFLAECLADRGRRPRAIEERAPAAIAAPAVPRMPVPVPQKPRAAAAPAPAIEAGHVAASEVQAPAIRPRRRGGDMER